MGPPPSLGGTLLIPPTSAGAASVPRSLDRQRGPDGLHFRNTSDVTPFDEKSVRPVPGETVNARCLKPWRGAGDSSGVFCEPSKRRTSMMRG